MNRDLPTLPGLSIRVNKLNTPLSFILHRKVLNRLFFASHCADFYCVHPKSWYPYGAEIVPPKINFIVITARLFVCLVHHTTSPTQTPYLKTYDCLFQYIMAHLDLRKLQSISENLQYRNTLNLFSEFTHI